MADDQPQTVQPTQPPLKLFLAETADATPAFAMIKSGRIRFSCVAASSRYVALGANTGSVYLLDNAPPTLRHRHLIAAMPDGGEITALTFAHNDAFLAIGTSRGVVTVLELTLDARDKTKVIERSTAEHKDHAITALQWTHADDKLFSADDQGLVYAIQLGDLFMSMFRKPELLYKADSKVVQLDILEDKLIVSSLTKVMLINYVRHEAFNVGKRARQGEFGACFVSQRELVSSRPGLRLWTVDMQGNVVATLNFQSSVTARAPSALFSVLPEGSVLDADAPTAAAPAAADAPKNEAAGVSFAILQKVHPQLVLSYNEYALFLIDLVSVDIHEWYDKIKDIRSVATYANQLFVLCEGARKLLCLSLQSPQRSFELLVEHKVWARAAAFALANRASVATSFAALKVLASNVAALGLTDEQQKEFDELVQESKKYAPAPKQAQPPPPIYIPAPVVATPPVPTPVAQDLQPEPAATLPEPETREEDADSHSRQQIPGQAESLEPVPPEPVPLEPVPIGDDDAPPTFAVDNDDASSIFDVPAAFDASNDISASGQKKKKKKAAPRRLVDIDTGQLVRTGSIPSNVAPSPTTSVSTPPRGLTRSDSSASISSVASTKSKRTTRSTSSDNLRETDKIEEAVTPAKPSSSAAPAPASAPAATATAPPTPPAQPPVATTPSPQTIVEQQQQLQRNASVMSSKSSFFDDIKKSTIDNIQQLQKSMMQPTTTQQGSSIPISAVLDKSTLPSSQQPQQTTTPISVRTTALGNSIPISAVATPITAAATPVAARSASDAAAAQVHQLAVLSENALNKVVQQQSNINGVHSGTNRALEEWLPFFYENIWPVRTKEPVASELSKRKANLKLLLTSCLELDVVTALKIPKPVKAVPAVDADVEGEESSTIVKEDADSNVEDNDDALVSRYVSEFIEYLDGNRVAAYCNRNDYISGLKALWLSEDSKTGRSDEPRLNVQKHLASGDSRRVFAILNNNSKVHSSLILRSLPKLLQLDGQASVQLMVNLGHYIHPRHVKTALGIDLAEPIPESGPLSAPWLTYANYLNHLVSTKSPLVRQDATIVPTFQLNTIAGSAALASSSSSSSSSSSKQWPNQQWPNQQWLLDLIVLATSESTQVQEALLAISQRHRFDYGAFELLVRLNRRKESVELAAKLDAIELLRTALFECRDETVWSHLIETLTEKFQSGTSSGAITKDFVLNELNLWLGPEKAMALLFTHPSFCDLLEPHLYETFLRAAEQDHKRSLIVHRMLESIDSYLWLRRPQMLASELRSLKDSELVDPNNLLPFFTRNTPDGPAELAFEYSTMVWPTYYEENSEHWGAWLKTGSAAGICAVCTMPLADSTTSVNVYQCSHAFHISCVPEDACPVCLSRNLGLLRDHAKEAPMIGSGPSKPSKAVLASLSQATAVLRS